MGAYGMWTPESAFAAGAHGDGMGYGLRGIDAGGYLIAEIGTCANLPSGMFHITSNVMLPYGS